MYHSEFGRRLRTQSGGSSSLAPPSSGGASGPGLPRPRSPGTPGTPGAAPHGASLASSSRSSCPTSLSGPSRGSDAGVPFDPDLSQSLGPSHSAASLARRRRRSSQVSTGGLRHATSTESLKSSPNRSVSRQSLGAGPPPISPPRPPVSSASLVSAQNSASRRRTVFADRFIPTRHGDDLHDAYHLLDDNPASPSKGKKPSPADSDALRAEASHAYSSVLGTELFGDTASGAAARAYALNGRSSASLDPGDRPSSPVPSNAGGAGPSSARSPRTPGKRNLLVYSPSPKGKRSFQAPGLGPVPTSGEGLFGSGDASKDDTSFSIDSPLHHSYSTSPVKVESQRLLLGPRRAPRVLPKVPCKVLDAPFLADDFYLNLVDWSSQNVLGVGLGACVYLWSARNSAITALCDLKPQLDKVTSLSWTGRGTHIAVGTDRGQVQIWDTDHCRLVRTLTGHTSRVGALAWNEHIVSSGSRDQSIVHWDVRMPEPAIQTLTAHKQEVCGLRWNTELNQLVSGGNDNRLYVWEGLRSEPLWRFNGHKAAVKAVAWSPHQAGLLASGGGTADMRLCFWNTLTGERIGSVHTGSQVCNVAWSKTANEVVSTHGYSEGKVQNQIMVWRYTNPHGSNPVGIHSSASHGWGGMNAAASSSSLPSLSSPSTDLLGVDEMSTGGMVLQPLANLTGHTMRVLYLAMAPDGDTIVTGAGDETLRFWDLNAPSRRAIEKRAQSTTLNPFYKLR